MVTKTFMSTELNSPRGNVRDYTAFQGIRGGITATDPNFPDEVLVSLNLRDRHLFDVHRLNLNTGALVFDTENPGNVISFTADPKFQILRGPGGHTGWGNRDPDSR